MIEKSESISIPEAFEYISEDHKELKSFMKKFIKISDKDAKELRKKIEELDLIKIRPSHISKILNLMPKTKEELNKIFTDVSLDENESNQILDAIKQFN
jgi:DNA-directed RNA polymerase subunit F